MAKVISFMFVKGFRGYSPLTVANFAASGSYFYTTTHKGGSGTFRDDPWFGSSALRRPEVHGRLSLRTSVFFSFAFAAALSVALAEKPLGQETYYRLDARQLQCIIGQADRYLAAGGDEILIAVSSCPEIPENPLFDAMTNEAPDIAFSSKNAVDSLLIVSREQFECLSGLAVGTNTKIYLYYPEECRLEAEGE